MINKTEVYNKIVAYFQLKNNVPLSSKNISKSINVPRKYVKCMLYNNDNFNNVKSIHMGSNKKISNGFIYNL